LDDNRGRGYKGSSLAWNSNKYGSFSSGGKREKRGETAAGALNEVKGGSVRGER